MTGWQKERDGGCAGGRKDRRKERRKEGEVCSAVAADPESLNSVVFIWEYYSQETRNSV